MRKIKENFSNKILDIGLMMSVGVDLFRSQCIVLIVYDLNSMSPLLSLYYRCFFFFVSSRTLHVSLIKEKHIVSRFFRYCLSKLLSKIEMPHEKSDGKIKTHDDGTYPGQSKR